eukprot:SAG22_NODE_1256_length_4995_cov_4.293096_2_plen_90_part_00
MADPLGAAGTPLRAAFEEKMFKGVKVSSKALSSLVLPLELCLRQCRSSPSVCPCKTYVGHETRVENHGLDAAIEQLWLLKVGASDTVIR